MKTLIENLDYTTLVQLRYNGIERESPIGSLINRMSSLSTAVDFRQPAVYRLSEDIVIDAVGAIEGLEQIVIHNNETIYPNMEGIQILSGSYVLDTDNIIKLQYLGGTILATISQAITTPSLESATIENAEPDELILVFDTAVTLILEEWSITTSGDEISLSSIGSGDGTDTIVIALSRAVVFGEVITISHSGGGTRTSAGGVLPVITDFDVTNSVAEV